MMKLILKIALGLVFLHWGCSHPTAANIKPTPQPKALPIEDFTGVIAFVHVNVVTMNDDRTLPDHTVIVRDGKIGMIGPSAQIAIPDGAYRIDGAGKYLMPGLADMHTHINYAEDLLPYVANGVTTVLNMGSPSTILQFREQVKRGGLLGPTIFASAFVDGEGDRGWIVRTPAEAQTDVRDIKSRGWDFIKVYNSISAEVFSALMNEAKQQEIAVIGHGVRAPGLQGILQSGQAMIAHAEEYLYTYFNNSLEESRISAAAAITQNAGALVTANLSTYATINLQWGNQTSAFRQTVLARPEIKYLHPTWLNGWRNSTRYAGRAGNLDRQLAFLQKLTKSMSDANVPLLLGTDSPSPDIIGMFPGFTIHEDLQAYVQAGLTPDQVLRAGTKNAGDFISRFVANAEAFGTIEIGKRADLILVTANPLADVANVSQRAGVMVRGRWLSEGKLQQLLDELAKSAGND